MIAPPPSPPVSLTSPSSRTFRSRAEWLDAAGITVSVVCAVHCAATGVFVAALSLLGVSGALPAWLEWAFLLTSLVIGVVALRQGRRAHGLALPLRLFALGIGLLMLARVAGLGPSALEVVLVVVAASCISAAHLLNWRQTRACESCACASCDALDAGGGS